MSGDTPSRREMLDAAWEMYRHAHGAGTVLDLRKTIEMLAAQPYVDALRKFAWLDASRETDRLLADFDAEYGKAEA